MSSELRVIIDEINQLDRLISGLRVKASAIETLRDQLKKIKVLVNQEIN